MKVSLKRLPLLVALAVLSVFAVGVVGASAHGGGPGGPGGGGPGGRGGPHLLGVSTSALVTEAAKQLGVSRASLVAAIKKSASTQIDEAVKDDDIDAARAADLKQEVEDNLSIAYHLSRASQVASNLNITTTKLNTEFRDARRALATARIDKALADGRITAAQAADLKARLAEADLPGYKGGFGFGGHHR